MALPEGRAYSANYFTHDFQIPLNSKLVSDWPPRNSINDQTSDKLPDMKWWLNVKTNLECETNYEFLDGNVKNEGDDQSIIDFDSLSYIGSDNLSVDQARNISPSNTRMRRIEASLYNDLHFTPKKKDQKEFCDVSKFSVSEKMASPDVESHLLGTEKPGPWWRNAGKDELAFLVAQKSLENVENCDLPQPQPVNFMQRFSKGVVDHDKNKLSSLNQKAETGSSKADGYTSGTTPTSGCSFQDSNSPFRSDQSKDSDSSNRDCLINSENRSITELLEALCHSQTRAREAEKAAQEAYNEKEHILSLFFKQTSQLFAYKQWFYMLQLENLCLQLRNKKQPLLNLFPAALPWLPHREMQRKKNRDKAEKRKVINRQCGIGKCVVAFAVGLSLAGAGLLLGWTMGWMFP